MKPAERQEQGGGGDKCEIDKLLLNINAAFDSLLERKGDFDAASVKDAFQGSMKTQMTLMKMLDALRDEVKSRIGIDRAKRDISGIRLYLPYHARVH